MANTPTDPLYADFDPDDLGWGKATLCLDCAKHPSLKSFVEANRVVGPVCGVCQEVAYRYPACDPARLGDLTNLIKALMRLYYNEYEYNGHWGAEEEPEGLLVKSNPILESESAPGRTRSPDRSSDFLSALFAEKPYPPENEGISLYAGHDEDGSRGIQFALKDRPSQTFIAIRARLAKENHFSVEPQVLGLIEKIASRITRIVPIGARYFRARIGVEARYQDLAGHGWDLQVLRKPFTGAKLGAPPPQVATAGRANRAGVAFLYLASDAATAAAEVRPHPGHFLSVGEFESLSELKVASFEADIMKFAGNEHDLELFHFIHSTDEIMALPVVPGDAKRYSVIQLIAECLRQKGFDAVAFKSSVEKGQNLCVFRPESFALIDGSEKVVEVQSLEYGLRASPTLLKLGENHRLIDSK